MRKRVGVKNLKSRSPATVFCNWVVFFLCNRLGIHPEIDSEIYEVKEGLNLQGSISKSDTRYSSRFHSWFQQDEAFTSSYTNPRFCSHLLRLRIRHCNCSYRWHISLRLHFRLRSKYFIHPSPCNFSSILGFRNKIGIEKIDEITIDGLIMRDWVLIWIIWWMQVDLDAIRSVNWGVRDLDGEIDAWIIAGSAAGNAAAVFRQVRTPIRRNALATVTWRTIREQASVHES